MTTEFEKLCMELNLNLNAPSQDALGRLKDWCTEHVDLVDLVLNSTTDTGMTPLHMAAVEGHVNIVEVLLELGADPRQLNQRKQFPIQSALFTPVVIDPNYKNRKIAIFNALKTYAPDTLFGKDNSKDTVAHSMAAKGYESLMADLIREHTPIVLSVNTAGKSAIHTAILNGQAGIVNQLLPVDDVMTLADSRGQVALHYAARSKLPEIILACCQAYRNANSIDCLDDEQKTPLLCAAEAGNLPALTTLIEHGADVNHADCHGYSALSYAKEKHFDEIAHFLLGKGAVRGQITP